jgi:hypothetical protein
VLSEAEKLELVNGDIGYRIIKDQFRMLLRILFELRQLAEDSFRLEGKIPPTLPSWGNDEDILDVYTQDSFEILGVCFRLEFENFLWLLNKYFDFAERRPQTRDQETVDAASESVKSTGNSDQSELNSRSYSQYEERGNVSKRSASSSYL